LTTYRESGVDPQKAERLVDYIKKKVKKAFGDYEGIGSFAGGISIEGIRNPVVFTSTDGVGTKLKIIQRMGMHRVGGIDLVAMNVNDVITTGAKPILFLDYIATGKIKEEVLKEVIDGIVEGCEEAECILAGGETAEMPGFYPEGVYDLAGFCVGICSKEEVIDGKGINPGDTVIGIPSSGFHSNGYSLIRKVIDEHEIDITKPIYEGSPPLCEILLKPTRIYVVTIQRLKKNLNVKGIAHITGGGIPGNLARILPDGRRAVIDPESWEFPEEMKWLMEKGGIPLDEMFRTFNMGIGMVVVVDGEVRDKALDLLEDAIQIGVIEEGKKGVTIRGISQS